MKIAVIGPICKDEINIDGKKQFQPGGVTYYTGLALSSLGADVTIFGAYNPSENDLWLEKFKKTIKLIQIPTTETLIFLNQYPDPNNPDLRIQKVKSTNCIINLNHLDKYNLKSYDKIILGPLFHNNFSLSVIKKLFEINSNIYLAGQGIIRYSKKGKIIWDKSHKLMEILPYIKALFVDKQEFEFINIREIILEENIFFEFKKLEWVIITNGSKGSTILVPHKKFKIPSFKSKEIVDATGAGDTYMAGILVASEKFFDIKQIGAFAAMSATLCLENKGALNKSFKEVLEKIKETEK